MSLIPTSITRQVFRTGLLLQKSSPNIMFGLGVAGVIGGTVLACRATLKLSDELPGMKEELEEVKEVEYKNPDDRMKALAYVYGKNTARVGKLYGPAVLVGATSIGLLTGSHITLNRRNAGLTAAYAAVSKAYDEYRDRVREELGQDREEMLYHAGELQKFETEDGKKTAGVVVNPTRWSPYARFFDEASENWQKNAELNRLFIQCQQNYVNHLLNARGHVFLNEVYDRLGLPRSQEGQVVGWVLSDDKEHPGDNYIDFGIFEASSVGFVNGWEPRILLDFNVDGVIMDKI